MLDKKTYRQVDPSLAEMVLEKLKKLNTRSRKIFLVCEIVIGKPQKLLKLAISEYKPAMMIVGTNLYGKIPLRLTESSLKLPRLNHYKHSPGTLPSHGHKISSSLFHHKLLFSKTAVSEYFLKFCISVRYCIQAVL